MGDQILIKLPPQPRMPQRPRRNPQHLRHIGRILAGKADGMAIAADGVGLNCDFVLDGLIGMVRMVQVHRVLGSDDPMGRGDAAIGGADRDAPGAGRLGKGLFSATGQATREFLCIGKNLFSQTQPSFADIPLKLFPQRHTDPCL